MKNRTGIDFSQHEHRIEIFKSDENEIRIDHFQVGNSNTKYIQFINTDRVLTVSGDYGNWVFCRPFVPGECGDVSDMYWIEKLKILSSQEPGKFSSEDTAEEIKLLIASGLEDYGYEGEELESIKEWYTDLLSYVDDEHEYIFYAYRSYDRPHNIDNESVPFCKELNNWLNIIFDAFDEICKRIREEKAK